MGFFVSGSGSGKRKTNRKRKGKNKRAGVRAGMPLFEFSLVNFYFSSASTINLKR